MKKGDELLKVTALVYFKDALVKQEFEACEELIALAKNFGASTSEVTDVIISFIRGDKTSGGRETNRIKNLQLLKEEQ
jgi:hypothetical protein